MENKNHLVFKQMEHGQQWIEGKSMKLPYYLQEDKIEATVKEIAKKGRPFTTTLGVTVQWVSLYG